MKFFVVADLHGSEIRIPEEVDAVIIAGDFTNADDPTFAAKVIDSIEKQVFAIPGNMDRKEVLEILEEKGVSVHLKEKKFQDIKIFGMGGSSTTPFNTPFEFSDEEIAKELDKFKGKFDIAVFHSPPYGLFDVVRGGVNVGSKSILNWIKENKPRVAICAHIHEHQGVAKLGDTIILKVWPANKQYGAILEINDTVYIRFVKF